MQTLPVLLILNADKFHIKILSIYQTFIQNLI